MNNIPRKNEHAQSQIGRVTYVVSIASVKLATIIGSLSTNALGQSSSHSAASHEHQGSRRRCAFPDPFICSGSHTHLLTILIFSLKKNRGRNRSHYSII